MVGFTFSFGTIRKPFASVNIVEIILVLQPKSPSTSGPDLAAAGTVFLDA
jgi:hypothetical protein